MLFNLAANARDAMPRGGTLTIRTANVDLDPDFVRVNVGAAAGPHVRLGVADTGVGMDAATVSRVFEPFFTTKSAGLGSGLGLATVYGIVKRAGGFIHVESAPDRGTSFSIYLPRTELPAEAPATRPLVTRPIGHERVLIIEDADPVRALAATVLQRSGYEVLDVPSGEAAERLFADDGFEVDLVLSDIVLKGMSGPQFAERLRAGALDARAVHVRLRRRHRARLRRRRRQPLPSCRSRSRPSRSPRRCATCSTCAPASALMGGRAKLIFFCGKMAAGKSTLSRALAEQEQAVLLVQDEWLTHLFRRSSTSPTTSDARPG